MNIMNKLDKQFHLSPPRIVLDKANLSSAVTFTSLTTDQRELNEYISNPTRYDVNIAGVYINDILLKDTVFNETKLINLKSFLEHRSLTNPDNSSITVTMKMFDGTEEEIKLDFEIGAKDSNGSIVMSSTLKITATESLSTYNMSIENIGLSINFVVKDKYASSYLGRLDLFYVKVK